MFSTVGKSFPKFSEIVKFVKCRKYSDLKFANFCIDLYCAGKSVTTFPCSGIAFLRNKKSTQNCKIYRTVFSAFYNILQPNLTIV